MHRSLNKPTDESSIFEKTQSGALSMFESVGRVSMLAMMSATSKIINTLALAVFWHFGYNVSRTFVQKVDSHLAKRKMFD